jgi:hypothetical protein
MQNQQTTGKELGKDFFVECKVDMLLGMELRISTRDAFGISMTVPENFLGKRITCLAFGV